jgi:hypothetical protein
LQSEQQPFVRVAPRIRLLSLLQPDRPLSQVPSVLNIRLSWDGSSFREERKFGSSDTHMYHGAQTALPTNRDVVGYVLRQDSVMIKRRDGSLIAGDRVRTIGTSYMFCDLAACYWTIELNYEPRLGCQWVLYDDGIRQMTHVTLSISKADMAQGRYIHAMRLASKYVYCLCGRTCLPAAGTSRSFTDVFDGTLSDVYLALHGAQAIESSFLPYNADGVGYRVYLAGKTDEEFNDLFVWGSSLEVYSSHPWPFLAKDTAGRSIWLGTGRVQPRICNATCVKDASGGSDTVRLCPETCSASRRRPRTPCRASCFGPARARQAAARRSPRRALPCRRPAQGTASATTSRP